jgi:methyl-accepting chemotaxis protein
MSPAGDRRLQFHGIDQHTAATLQNAKALILSLLPPALDAFYAHIAQVPEAAGFFRNEAHINYARTMQLRHWELLSEGRFDAAYVASVTKIGETHSRIGLAPTWYIGGYSFMLANMLGAIGARHPFLPFGKRAKAAAVALQQALTKAVMLDMDHVIAVYLDAEKRERLALLERVSTRFEASIGAIAASVAVSAAEMRATAEVLARNAEQTNEEVDQVASASKETSSSMAGVAVAAGGMAQTMSDISREVGEVSKVAVEAAATSRRTVARIERLSEASRRIGAIVELISDIATRTNLLALNATIEAARAGDAGRGFSVVAQAVKTLAEQTGQATSDIGVQIDEMQAAVSESVGGIAEIAAINERIDVIAGVVSAAARDQETATRQIASSVQQVSDSTLAVTRTMANVSEAAAATGNGAAQMLASASDLAAMSEKLQAEVSSFLGQLGAA